MSINIDDLQWTYDLTSNSAYTNLLDGIPINTYELVVTENVTNVRGVAIQNPKTITFETFDIDATVSGIYNGGTA